jgi:hypothetical protein
MSTVPVDPHRRSGPSTVLAALGALACLWIAAIGAAPTLPLPPAPEAWGRLARTAPDVAVMAGFRLAAIVVSAHAALVLCLGVVARLDRGRRASSAWAGRVAMRIAGPAWRRWVASTIGISLVATAPAGAATHPGRNVVVAVASAGHGGPQRWPEAASAPSPAAAPPMLVRLGPVSGSRPTTPARALPMSKPTPTTNPTTAPPTTAPPTTAPPTTTPPTTAPPTTAPPTTAPPTTTRRLGAPRTWVVRPGDHLWSIAERVQQQRSGPGRPTEREIARLWIRIIEENRASLPDPANPDLIVPGMVLALPPA